MAGNLTIRRAKEESNNVLFLEGRLETTTSVKLQSEAESLFSSESEGDIILDISDVSYISSAGLRVILAIEKKCRAQGRRHHIRGTSETIREIFDMTGFSGMLNLI
ncbi:MAG: STAS domain-containing protein [Oscillospiraceae bacterium]|nr:STAS domain-containing protein [Oscillospiraceae bacterium]